jgi:hypothetical protein
MRMPSGHRGRQPSLRRVVATVPLTVATLAAGAGSAAAAPVGGEPDPTGMPGAELVSQLINWLMWVSLMASLGAVLYGAALWRGGARLGNSPRAEDGRNYVAGGAVGALLSGMAVVLINTLFEVGRAGG